jgi:hypothetical protein
MKMPLLFTRKKPGATPPAPPSPPPPPPDNIETYGLLFTIHVLRDDSAQVILPDGATWRTSSVTAANRMARQFIKDTERNARAAKQAEAESGDPPLGNRHD